MVHYHVWFNLRSGVEESEGLRVVSLYLADLQARSEAVSFHLLRNRGSAPRSKLPRYHALVEFSDMAQLGLAMKHQSAAGVHHGNHGQMVDVVCDFHVEIFEQFEVLGELQLVNRVDDYACEL